MSYSLLVEKKKVKEYLDSLQDDRRETHIDNLQQLSNHPYPGDGPGDKKQIKARDISNKLFRIRSGDYRGIYRISEREETVYVLNFGRKEDIEPKYGP